MDYNCLGEEAANLLHDIHQVRLVDATKCHQILHCERGLEKWDQSVQPFLLESLFDPTDGLQNYQAM